MDYDISTANQTPRVLKPVVWVGICSASQANMGESFPVMDQWNMYFQVQQHLATLVMVAHFSTVRLDFGFLLAHPGTTAVPAKAAQHPYFILLVYHR